MGKLPLFVKTRLKGACKGLKHPLTQFITNTHQHLSPLWLGKAGCRGSGGAEGSSAPFLGALPTHYREDTHH